MPLISSCISVLATWCFLCFLFESLSWKEAHHKTLHMLIRIWLEYFQLIQTDMNRIIPCNSTIVYFTRHITLEEPAYVFANIQFASQTERWKWALKKMGSKAYVTNPWEQTVKVAFRPLVRWCTIGGSPFYEEEEGRLEYLVPQFLLEPFAPTLKEIPWLPFVQKLAIAMCQKEKKKTTPPNPTLGTNLFFKIPFRARYYIYFRLISSLLSRN